MNFGFWKQLPRPFTVLAPMSGYTDAAFRCILARYGKPDVICTEFVPVDGLCSGGRENLLPLLWLTEAERPIVAQIYGGNPDNYFQAAALLSKLGFDGIDINMGCPARVVESRLGGSALIKDPQRAIRIIEAAQAGAGGVPVSVKTRIGYNSNEIETWLITLLETRLAAVILHARTRAEAYNVPARWEVITQAVALARAYQPDAERRTLIVGNGDVVSLADAKARAQASGCDGVMAGRATCGNPWFFNPAVRRDDVPLVDVIRVMHEHTQEYMKLHGAYAPLEPLKKHFKAYVKNFPRAAALRARLMRFTSHGELESILRSVLPGFEP